MAIFQSLSSAILCLLSIKYLAVLLPTVHADSTVSIISQPAFSRVHPCVQHCMWCGEYWLINCPGHADGLNNVLQCNNLDSLFCRSDLLSTASSYLTTCIYSQCDTNSIDLSDGLSLYNGYCGIDGATLDNYPSVSAKTTDKSTSEAKQSSSPTKSVSDLGTTTLAASPGSTPSVVVYSTVIDGSSTRATVTSEWPLEVAVLLAIVMAGGVDLFQLMHMGCADFYVSKSQYFLYDQTHYDSFDADTASETRKEWRRQWIYYCKQNNSCMFYIGRYFCFCALFAGRRWWKRREKNRNPEVPTQTPETVQYTQNIGQAAFLRH